MQRVYCPINQSIEKYSHCHRILKEFKDLPSKLYHSNNKVSSYLVTSPFRENIVLMNKAGYSNDSSDFSSKMTRTPSEELVIARVSCNITRIVLKNDRGSKNWFVKICEGNNEKAGTTGCFTRLWGTRSRP